MPKTEPTDVLVDPAISRTKFEREIAEYRQMEDEHIRRGWWMLKAEFPEVFVVFATPQIKPPSVVFGALLDFTNYDFWPPSVRLVDPFPRKPYSARELPTALPRAVIPEIPAEWAAQGLVAEPQVTTLMQTHNPDDPDDIPFLCLPGVREYHQHPAHSGDDWLLHRGRGEGTLYFILEKLHHYGILSVTGYQMRVQVLMDGYQFGAVRE